jgi:endonuclease/exonuclease/phosphatase family metal-dependent hydrolase
MERAGAELNIGGPELKPAYEPIVENRPARDRRGPARVVLLNARGGARLDAIARCLSRAPLASASVVLLCEADLRTRRAYDREVARELAALLNMSYVFLPEFAIRLRDGRIHGYLGNAILSAEPFEDVRAIPLPNPGPRRGKRLAGATAGIIASARLGGQRLTIGVAHLNSRCDPAGRASQMAAYLAEFPEHGPAVFGGDLNTTTTELGNIAAFARTAVQMVANPRRFRSPQRYEPLFARLAERGLEIHGANVMNRATFTFARAVPRFMRPKLDWLATREVKPVRRSAAVVPSRASIFSPRASDHDFVMVDLDL